MAVYKNEIVTGIDVVISEMQDILDTELPWLSNVYGRAQTLRSREGNREHLYPAQLLGSEYQDLRPNDTIANFCFFTLKDPQEVKFNKNDHNITKTPCSIIFWFNLYNSDNWQMSEEIKNDVMDVLTRSMYLKTGRFDVEKIYNEAENIYKGFSLKEVDSQYLMHPFGGFRVEGKLTQKETCL